MGEVSDPGGVRAAAAKCSAGGGAGEGGEAGGCYGEEHTVHTDGRGGVGGVAGGGGTGLPAPLQHGKMSVLCGVG